MMRADLHVHSRYSAHPSEWFLQRLGTRESYTDIETIYECAIKQGMQLVTITDHNCIDGIMELQSLHPDNVFTGVEVTTYFPEDGCKIHVLIYGFNEQQFRIIEKIRCDIYELRDYLKEQELTHSIAHATFSINKKMSVDHFCKLLLLFDYFEVVNGARNQRSNQDLLTILNNLTPEIIYRLREEYTIEPFSSEPWKKGFTGGSDDHSGLNIAQCFTSVPDAKDFTDFLIRLRKKESLAQGKHNDFKRFAFSIYKIAFDFSKEKSPVASSSLITTLNEMFFYGKARSVKNRLTFTKIKFKKESDFQSRLIELINNLERIKGESINTKVDVVYSHLSSLCDEFMKTILTSLKDSLCHGDFLLLFRSVASLLPMLFLSFPFFSTIHIMNEPRKLQALLNRKFGIYKPKRSTRILWFTDTITDLNGPSETIRKCVWMGFHQNLDLIPVVSLLPNEKEILLPPTVINLSPIFAWAPDFFNSYSMRLPSLLNSIRIICEKNPDEILVSTPGPLGLLGLLCSKLLHIPCKGIFHSDFTKQFSLITGDETVCNIIEEYIRWFYSQCSEIKVPTREYISILAKRGYSLSKMTLFPRGIESEIFKPRENSRKELFLRYGIPEDKINLLYVGRISPEKHVDMLFRIHQQLLVKEHEVNLIFAGNGPEPYFTDFKKLADKLRGVFFLDRLPRNELPVVYSGADLMLFPSTTDTFGMVVLEAQSCGLPVIVSDVGGPKEIVLNGKTGYVLPAYNAEVWVEKIETVITLINSYSEHYLEMRHTARRHVISNYNWQVVLDNLFEITENDKRDEDIFETKPFVLDGIGDIINPSYARLFF